MHRLILLLTFTESFATILLERGLYFYTYDRLAFSTSANLTLALIFGLMYAAGAWSAHRLCQHISERTLFALLTAGLLIAHLAIGFWPTATGCMVGFPLVGLLSGAKWPIIETYVTAGCTPRKAIAAIGRFNVSWALAVPISLAITGPLIASRPDALFFLAAGIHLTTLALLFGLPKRPAHLKLDHPEQPNPETLARYGHLQTSARWAMLGSCAMAFLLAPLLPGIFQNRLGHSLQAATGLSAGLDVARVLTFAALGLFTAWRGKKMPLVLGALGLPLGLGLTLLGPNTATVLTGEAIFGIASGIVYYAALYHTMVLLNASIAAGSAHETLIGLGFALGPAIGLLAGVAGHATQNQALGLALVVGPTALLTTLLALRPLGFSNVQRSEKNPCDTIKSRH